MMPFQKVILWGHPLYSHTYSYIHAAFFKAFEALGFQVFWFHDYNFPENFDYSNTLFITEGFADKFIPLNDTSIYVVHGVQDPRKYQEANPMGFVDMRYNHVWHSDHIYNFTIDKKTLEKVGPSCYFESKKNSTIQYSNSYISNITVPDYDKFYITWATNKLPDEIDFDDVNFPRNNEIHFCGNLSSQGRCENLSVFQPFINECIKNNIPFLHNDPFSNPLTEEEIYSRIKKSLIAVDLRGPEHLRNGYVPCRVFKSISVGHLGMTNSPEVAMELEGHCLLDTDPASLFYSALEKSQDKEFILDSMKYVKYNHTYINRVKSLLEVVYRSI
jgi:hypothetical protein